MANFTDGSQLSADGCRGCPPFLPTLTLEDSVLTTGRLMPLELFNTLSTKVEEFHPLEDNLVRMYACGPTVYDYGHIGNFRTFIAVDLLYRFLRQGTISTRRTMVIAVVGVLRLRRARAARLRSG